MEQYSVCVSRYRQCEEAINSLGLIGKHPMEISGLALTIPTWMAAIARAEKKTDMNLATDYAKKQLAGSLLRLESQIQKTLEALECTDKDF